MKLKSFITGVALLLGVGLHAQSIWNPAQLAEVKPFLQKPPYKAAYQELIKKADGLLKTKPLSVMMKEAAPASGDMHDYMSLARYFWPDPSKPDGLPYITKDGESNPELEKYDRNPLGNTASRVTTLSLAWYFSGNEKYAKKATELLRVWFLNKDTRMNPHLEYAQVAKGHDNNKGRSYGVLDTYSFVEMLDAVALLEQSKSFTEQDARALKQWFSQLLHWMLTSPQGKGERAAANNHGTAYDAQVIAFALYTGETDLARSILNAVPRKRIFTQIEPDGKQPQELRRTLAFGYSQYNLTHLIDIFQMGKKIGVRIDKATSIDGRNFYKAMDFLVPYVGKSVESWPYQQISEWDYKQQEFCKDLYRTYSQLDMTRTDYLQLFEKYYKGGNHELFNLLYLRPADAGLTTARKIRLDGQWQFIRQDMGSIWEVMRPFRPGQPESVPLWQTVTLPHCFNAEDAVDPDVNYYQGPGWYRTTLDINNPYQNGRIYLDFEGAGQKTEVYVYTTLVGKHVGGYDGWKVDITEAVAQVKQDAKLAKRFGGKIPIAIRCDNSRDTQMIPSDMSDFNVYGGLYRYVNLVYTPACSIENVRVESQTDEKGRQGKITVKVQPVLSGERPITFEARILSPEGNELYRFPLNKATQGEGEYTGNVQVKRPALWSPDSPMLYTCVVEAVCDGDTLAEAHRFGFRHFRFEEHGPFYLNGQRLLLRGTHRHEDHAGIGAALTEDMMRAEMKQIKDMGANFIRLGHYQQSDIILQLCDELGILVWEEIPWCRGGIGNAQYRKQAHDMLESMITRHHNHPSIILWGLGNENDWPGDFETFPKDSIHAFMAELHDHAYRIDSTRLTCIRRCDFCKDVVDVYSPSIWAGWYSGNFRDYYQKTEDAVRNTPRFFHAEWGGDSHAGRHTEGNFENVSRGDSRGDWSESYIVRLFDWHLKEQERMPWLTGSAFWTFKDFSTPLRPTNPVPYVNQKGVVGRDGKPKESYYVFQSYWSKEPMVHIYGHTWPVRWGKKGEAKEILVYSNCPEVELFVNGQSQGIKKRDSQDYPAAGLHWNVVLQEGHNEIKAVATYGKQTLTDSIAPLYETRTWGKPEQIVLTQTPLDEETVRVDVELTDKAGVKCLDSRDVIDFSCTRPEALIQNQGTVGGSRRVQATNGTASIQVKTIYGPVVVSVRVGEQVAFIKLLPPTNL